MENKLYRAAGTMPMPQTTYPELKSRMQPAPKVRRLSRRVLVAAAVILLLITTAFAYSSQQIGFWAAGSSKSYADVKILNRKYDYCFPEDLEGLPFAETSSWHSGSSDISHWEALQRPGYDMHCVYYQTEDIKISISFGTTDHENWRYHFGVAADGSCSYEGVTPGSQSTVQYGGYLLHLYTVDDRHTVRWEDAQRQIVINLTGYGLENQTEVLQYAQILIDLNEAQ